MSAITDAIKFVAGCALAAWVIWLVMGAATAEEAATREMARQGLCRSAYGKWEPCAPKVSTPYEVWSPKDGAR